MRRRPTGVGKKLKKEKTKIDDRSFKDLVDYWQGQILIYLLRGDLRGGVFMALNDAVRWREKNG